MSFERGYDSNTGGLHRRRPSSSSAAPNLSPLPSPWSCCETPQKAYDLQGKRNSLLLHMIFQSNRSEWMHRLLCGAIRISDSERLRTGHRARRYKNWMARAVHVPSRSPPEHPHLLMFLSSESEVPTSTHTSTHTHLGSKQWVLGD